MEYQYRKNDALVDFNAESDKIKAKITRGESVLELDMNRHQDLRKEERLNYGWGEDHGTSIHGDYVATYNIDVKIGEAKQHYSTSFIAHSFEVLQGNYEEQNYNYGVDLSKGIPPKEYKSLLDGISEQSTAMKQIFEKYILDSENLSKENNLSQSTPNSAFNKALDNFLNGGR